MHASTGFELGVLNLRACTLTTKTRRSLKFGLYQVSIFLIVVFSPSSCETRSVDLGKTRA